MLSFPFPSIPGEYFNILCFMEVSQDFKISVFLLDNKNIGLSGDGAHLAKRCLAEAIPLGHLQLGALRQLSSSGNVGRGVRGGSEPALQDSGQVAVCQMGFANAQCQ